MKQSGGITIYSPSSGIANTVTVIFKDDSADVEIIVDATGEVLYEAEGES